MTPEHGRSARGGRDNAVTIQRGAIISKKIILINVQSDQCKKLPVCQYFKKRLHLGQF